MGVNLSGSTPRNPYGSSSILDRIFGASGSIGGGFADGLRGILDGIGEILGGAIEVAGQAFSGIVNGVVNLVGGIADGIRGLLPNTSPFSPVQDAFYDGQRALTERLDLLEGVQAYGHSFMGRNINAQWGANNWRDLKFDEPLGPAVGAHVDPSKGGIVFESAGLWTVYVRVTGRATGFTGGGGMRMDVNTRLPDGSIYSTSIVEGTSYRDLGTVTPDLGNTTLQATFPIVIDTPGSYVTVRAWTAAWRWWNGGTRWSSMSVLKHSSSTVNAGTGTVPDETQP